MITQTHIYSFDVDDVTVDCPDSPRVHIGESCVLFVNGDGLDSIAEFAGKILAGVRMMRAEQAAQTTPGNERATDEQIIGAVLGQIEVTG